MSFKVNTNAVSFFKLHAEIVEREQRIIRNFKRVKAFLVYKTCFDVVNVIVSYKVFEKPLKL